MAVSRSLVGDAGSRKLIDTSEDSSAVDFGSVVKTAPARAASATKPSVPPAKTPAAVCHQALGGDRPGGGAGGRVLHDEAAQVRQRWCGQLPVDEEPELVDTRQREQSGLFEVRERAY